jgi:hypothetical protein
MEPDPQKPRFIYIGTIDYQKGILGMTLEKTFSRSFKKQIIGSGSHQSAFSKI